MDNIFCITYLSYLWPTNLKSLMTLCEWHPYVGEALMIGLLLLGIQIYISNHNDGKSCPRLGINHLHSLPPSIKRCKYLHPSSSIYILIHRVQTYFCYDLPDSKFVLPWLPMSESDAWDQFSIYIEAFEMHGLQRVKSSTLFQFHYWLLVWCLRGGNNIIPRAMAQ